MRATPQLAHRPRLAPARRHKPGLACALVLLGSACLRSGFQAPPWLDAAPRPSRADAGPVDAAALEAAVRDAPVGDAAPTDSAGQDIPSLDGADADATALDAATDAAGADSWAGPADGAGEAGPAADVLASDIGGGDAAPADSGWTPARLAFAPGTPYDYGAVLASATAVHSFEVLKTGDSAATGVSATLAPPFRFAGGAYPGLGGTCSPSIGADCTIVVEFAPTAPGAAQAALELAYHDGAAAQSVLQQLSGLGQILALRYWEQQNVFGGGAYGQHRLLVGPGSSLDPEDGAWTELADGAAMYNADAFSGWSPGLLADLTAWSGQSVRVAFHYYGSNRDKWYVDDVCAGPYAGSAVATLCALAQSFDSTSQLPAGWFDVPGAANTDAAAWRTSVDQGHTAVSAAVADPSSRTTLKDRYLVSPAFSLP